MVFANDLQGHGWLFIWTTWSPELSPEVRGAASCDCTRVIRVLTLPERMILCVIFGRSARFVYESASTKQGQNIEDLSRYVMVGEPKENVELLIGTVVTW
ncbi:hypothetical protein OIU77_001118 [Salix suchowensis]|uniref:Uncharacterized protein n=1 Tax=Salix suchowensis TaxID=1278906 RepID=A0ABQ8ZGI1_9ROSI|nr:hypothetical protein OIU77_001118 [Salix suchowensis]KAJ6313818.1 hypothetical protein OIU78_017460 [Salix suchowensis]